MTTGEFEGKLSGGGAEYSGEITDPDGDNIYCGAGTVEGNCLKWTGCALKIF